jgi:hypothetical protein
MSPHRLVICLRPQRDRHRLGLWANNKVPTGCIRTVERSLWDRLCFGHLAGDCPPAPAALAPFLPGNLVTPH